MGPFQLEQLAAPHAGEQYQTHEVCRLDVLILVYRLKQSGQLLRGEVFGFAVVDGRHFNLERGTLT